MRENLRKPAVLCAVLIALCFLVTSAAWLTWEYHLLGMLPAGQSDFCTMVAGYLLQAAGIGLYLVCQHRNLPLKEHLLTAALILHVIFLFPAVLSPYPAGALVFGFLMNLACGVVAGGYLSALTALVPEKSKATVFGIGYGLSILMMWLLSVIRHGSLYYSRHILLICILLTGAAACAAERTRVCLAEDPEVKKTERISRKEKTVLLTAGVLVLLFSIVNSSGFAFSSADLGQAVNIELSRLAYAVGLIIAGIVTDRSRKAGAVCALAGLMIPFIILALQGAGLSLILFWLLSYLTFGFYSVFRIILFSDLSATKKLPGLAGAGLMIGRIGDALGETICLVFAHRLALRVILTALLFIAAVAVFFRIYQTLYIPETQQQKSEKEKFYQFSVEHDLSARERDLLRLLLDGRTNKEIADELSISENTVKFHVRNILQKTGCRNRGDLVASYVSRFQG